MQHKLNDDTEFGYGAPPYTKITCSCGEEWYTTTTVTDSNHDINIRIEKIAHILSAEGFLLDRNNI